MDDAYITADFAKTWVEGGGARWFHGAARVEGFSSPLWVAIMALLHLLPGFSKDALGLYVLLTNMALAFGCAWAFVTAVATIAEAERGDRRVPTQITRLCVWIPTVVISTISLLAWAARGFEVVLVALFCLLGFVEALRGNGMRPARVGLWVGLAFVARMDALVYCVPTALLVLRRPTRARVLTAGIVASAFAAALFLSRRWYYGDWLPNTYYLKATKWPLGIRLPQGWIQNGTAGIASLLGLPAFWYYVRRRLGAARFPIFAATLGHLAALIYSTWIGGDFASEMYGYDRFTSIGSVFLVLAIAACIGTLEVRAGVVGFAIVSSWLAFFPVAFQVGIKAMARRTYPELTLANLVNPKRGIMESDGYAQLFIHFGKSIREFTLPGATVAGCAAGAMIYFSDRGGVDLLGKVDPLIAKLPATIEPPPEHRCWRGNPGAGHNKENIALSFATHSPDVSMVEPPDAFRDRYKAFRYKVFEYWGRKDSRFIDWTRARAGK
jgi:hypothetical protein